MVTITSLIATSGTVSEFDLPGTRIQKNFWVGEINWWWDGHGELLKRGNAMALPGREPGRKSNHYPGAIPVGDVVNDCSTSALPVSLWSSGWRVAYSGLVLSDEPWCAVTQAAVFSISRTATRATATKEWLVRNINPASSETRYELSTGLLEKEPGIEGFGRS